MSSTNRGAVRNKDDYYVTPHNTIREFLAFVRESDACIKKPFFYFGDKILDPSAGGCANYEMSYPKVLEEFDLPAESWDIREDSRADKKGINFLDTIGKEEYDTVITNPPFNQATEFVEKALEHVADHGLVIMLQRLNWLGSQKRKQFWQTMPLAGVFIHSKRPGFDPENPNDTDSTEYAHFVFIKNYKLAASLYSL